MQNTDGFLEIVQLHERMWGTEAYPGRPSLADLMKNPIVVMWVEVTRVDSKRSDPRSGYFMLATYTNADEMNQALLEALMMDRVTSKPCRKVSKIYLNQQIVKIKGLQLIVEKAG